MAVLTAVDELTAVDTVTAARVQARSRAQHSRRIPTPPPAALAVLPSAVAVRARTPAPPASSPPSTPADFGDATATSQRASLRSIKRGVARAKWSPDGEIRRDPERSAAFARRRRLNAGNRRRGRHVGLPGSLTSGPRGPS
jgi:hypothetical protein